MKYILTLNFNLEVETGDKNIKDVEAMIIKSYSSYLGENVTVTKRDEKISSVG